ncbi:MAG: adenylosuccinate lyase [Planctomycetes bacterium]|nr:adenylosuccinate lyase [Planctomycetota bacterium]
MKTSYQSPLVSRYGSQAMLYNFSDEHRLITWREVWIALAEAEQQMGLPVTGAQINELKRFRTRINDAAIAKYEKLTKHEVVGHIKAYGEQCPKAKPIIHLGATSATITDNADIIVYRKALAIIKKRLTAVINASSRFAAKYKGMPTCGFTHFQPALLTTVGKRACLWLQDLVIDFRNMEHLLEHLPLLGAKGAIGTQASFVSLFNGNINKVYKLESIFARKLGFKSVFPVAGQVYTRKLDYSILSLLSGIAQSAHKFSQDVRLLQGLGELEEPFSKDQVGSSAMAYKRNPIHCERITSLSRYAILLSNNMAFTHANQWLERSLDDSANRRLSIPEAFLTIDAILNLYDSIISGLVVYPAVMAKRLSQELPFMVTEDIMMAAVNAGGDRQELHHRIRQHSMAAAHRIKQGGDNDLIARLSADSAFAKVRHQFKNILEPRKHIGLAEKQVEMFLKKEVAPLILPQRH